MTATTESTKRKLSLLQLAEELGNVSKACQIMGYHRDTFYEVRRAFQVGGVAALVEQKRGPKSPHPKPRGAGDRGADTGAVSGAPNLRCAADRQRTAATERRCQSLRGSRRLAAPRSGYAPSAPDSPRDPRAGRHGSASVTSRSGCWERHSCDFRMRHVEVSAPGELLNQDTFYWGTLKGVGKIYVQVVVDAFCSLAFAKVYTSKMPITAAKLLYDRVLPFYEALGVPVQAVLTDNGREFCGRPKRHPYELLLALHDIEHRRTKIRSPRTNGFVERMNRTLLDECFRVKGRTTWYISPEEIQRDLDQYLSFYNLKRSHQGYRVKGRTPGQALREALGRKRFPPIVPKENLEVVKEAA